MSGRNLGLYTFKYEPGLYKSQEDFPSKEDFDRLIEEHEGCEFPTEDDFDLLIEEQDCFEISLREEKKKSKDLRKEKRRLKMEMRGVLHCRDEAKSELAEAKNIILAQKLEIEELKSKLLTPTALDSKPPKPVLKAVRSVPLEQQHPPEELNNNQVALRSAAPEKKVSAQKTTGRRLRAASVVAHLVQGFEAAAAANSSTSTTNEIVRRKTIHGCSRTVTL